MPWDVVKPLSVKPSDLHVSHLVGNDEGAGESLVPVEGAASCWVARPRNGGVTRWSTYIGACQPYCQIVLPAELLIPPVDVLE